MGESRTPRPNKPIGECTTGLVDVFSVRFGLPSTGFVSAGPLVLDPRFRRPVPAPRDKAGGTTHHWLLGSESVSRCLFGIYCLSVV